MKETTPEEQAVLVQVNGIALPDDLDVSDLQSLEEQYGIRHLEEQLTSALGDRGEYDGHEFGNTEINIYLYGSDAEAMFEAVKPVLKADRLPRGASVTIRKGKPGAPSRVVHLAAH